MSQFNPVCTLTPYLFKIHFDIILPPTRSCHKLSLPNRFSDEYAVCTFRVFHHISNRTRCLLKKFRSLIGALDILRQGNWNCFTCFCFRLICCSHRFARHFDLMISVTLIITSQCRVTAGVVSDSVPTYCSMWCLLHVSLWNHIHHTPLPSRCEHYLRRPLSFVRVENLVDSSFTNESLMSVSQTADSCVRERSSMATVEWRVGCN
jgi:hypothetical protein